MVFYKNEAGGFIGLNDDKRCVMQIDIPAEGQSLVIHNEHPDTEDGNTSYTIFKERLSQLQGATDEEIAIIKETLRNHVECASAALEA